MPVCPLAHPPLCAVSLESIISSDHSSSLTEYRSAGPVNEKPKQILLEEMERGWGEGKRRGTERRKRRGEDRRGECGERKEKEERMGEGQQERGG